MLKQSYFRFRTHLSKQTLMWPVSKRKTKNKVQYFVIRFLIGNKKTNFKKYISFFKFDYWIGKRKTKNLVWFKTNFKKQKSKFLNSFFDFKSKNEFQRVLSFFNFDYETEKWKMKNSQNSFCFEIKKRIILSVHVFIFNAFIRFSFSQKMENEIQFVFRFSFSWRNWKTNYLNSQD